MSEPGGKRYDAIFSGPLGAPQLQFRTGYGATDRTGVGMRNAFFTQLEQPVFAGESFAFKGRMVGPGVMSLNDAGIWVKDAEGLRLVAREGFEAPGTNGARFTVLESLVMPDPGSVFFTAKLWDGTRGLWAWRRQTGLARVLWEGQVIRGTERLGRVASFQAISLVPGSPGHGRYDASQQTVDALVRFDDGRTAILTVNAQGIIRVVGRTLDALEDGNVLLKLGRPSSPGQRRLPVAAVEFGSTTGERTRQRGIMDFENGGRLALAGSIAPGTIEETFVSFKDPVAGLTANLETLVAFQAVLSDDAKETNTGIWSVVSGAGEAKLIARKGHAAPGAEGKTFQEFKSLSLIDGRGPLFTASLSSGNEYGCWAADANGMLELLLLTGDVVGGKSVRSFDVLTAVPGSPGQRRASVETAHGPAVIFRVEFTDHTQGIATVTLP